jgi:hypothetical protein
MLIKFGTWLRVKRNFYLYFVLSTGIPGWLGAIWLTWGYVPGALWIAFLAVVILGASLLGAFLMWHFFSWYFPPLGNHKRQGEN